MVLTLLVLYRYESHIPFFSAEGEGGCESTAWLTSMINGMKHNPAIKSEVIRYKYNNQTVFYIDSCKGCADSMGVVYNCAGEVICQFGGIAGFNTCPDFFEKATSKKVLWKN